MYTRIEDKPLPALPPSPLTSRFSAESAGVHPLHKMGARSISNLRAKAVSFSRSVCGLRGFKSIPVHEPLRPCQEFYCTSTLKSNHIQRQSQDRHLFEAHARKEAAIQEKAAAKRTDAEAKLVDSRQTWNEDLINLEPSIDYKRSGQNSTNWEYHNHADAHKTPSSLLPVKGAGLTPQDSTTAFMDPSVDCLPIPLRATYCVQEQKHPVHRNMQNLTETTRSDHDLILFRTEKVLSLWQGLSQRFGRLRCAASIGRNAPSLLDGAITPIPIEVMTPRIEGQQPEESGRCTNAFTRQSDAGRWVGEQATVTSQDLVTACSASEAAEWSNPSLRTDSSMRRVLKQNEMGLQETERNFLQGSEYPPQTMVGAGSWSKNLGLRLRSSKEMKCAAELEVPASNSVFISQLSGELEAAHEPASLTGLKNTAPPDHERIATMLNDLRIKFRSIIKPVIRAGLDKQPSVAIIDGDQFELGKRVLLVQLNLARETCHSDQNREIRNIYLPGPHASAGSQSRKIRLNQKLDEEARAATERLDRAAIRRRFCSKCSVEKMSIDTALQQCDPYAQARLTELQMNKETGHVEIIGPAGFGALATAIEWNKGGHLIHAIPPHGDAQDRRMRLDCNGPDPICQCRIHMVWQAITDESYRYVGFATSQVENRWIAVLAKKRPHRRPEA